jgi:predicted ATP-binding protein involved in virulence
MLLSRLKLENYRGFAKLDLYFDPKVTVLVGVNGAGKTSVLHAARTMLSYIPMSLQERLSAMVGESFVASDVRSGGGVLLSHIEITGPAANWGFSQVLTPRNVVKRAYTSFDDFPELQDYLRSALVDYHGKQAPLPLVVYYPVNRNVLEAPENVRDARAYEPTDAFDGALEGTANFTQFLEWFREAEDLHNEQIARSVESGVGARPASTALGCVRRAISGMMPDVTDVRIERSPQRMTLLKKGLRLDIAQLSDGEKCLFALVGDLARRLALVAHTLDDPLTHTAVVLIDEIDLHLHPGLQRTVLPSLQRVFPNVQFVVTSHSPQVLASVRGKQVGLLENFQLVPLKADTWQRATSDVLDTVFGDPGRPLEINELLVRLKNAVDEDQVTLARRLIAQLREKLEGEDPEVFYQEQLLPPEAKAVGSSE